MAASSSWRATVTPLASIMGSGFLVSAPLLAMAVGFSKLILAAIACYLLSGLIFSHLPKRSAAI